MYNDGPFNCPHCETALMMELGEKEEETGKHIKKMRKVTD